MGRFSAWAEHRTSAKAVVEGAEGKPKEVPGFFLVDNSELLSSSQRLRYRFSMQLEDKDKKRKGAAFGTVLRGVPTPDGLWLRVGSRYLPMRIGCCTVVVPSWGDDAAAAAAEAEEDEADADPFAQELQRWKSMASPEAGRSLAPGCGARFEVFADRVFVRTAPSMQARICGTRPKGQVVELFDWDSTRLWRRLVSTKPLTEGWVLLDHPQLGALLRPEGQPFSARPLEPICVAAREGCVEDLRALLCSEPSPEQRKRAAEARCVDGKEPLQLAAELGHLQCCFFLLHAGARLRRPLARQFASKSQGAAALASAVSGWPAVDDDVDAALGDLSEEDRLSALTMLAHVPVLGRADAGARLQAERGASLGASSSGDVARAGAAGLGDGAERLENSAEAVMPTCSDPTAQAAEARAHQPLKDLPATLVSDPEGVVHEVLHKMVFVREHADRAADPVTSLKAGDWVDIVDKCDGWGRVRVVKPQGVVSGWVLMVHPAFGVMLSPVEPS